MKKIVSHLPPRHLDDWLALVLLRDRYPLAKVEYVHPQGVPEDYLEDPEVILVDVGGRYEPGLGNFDHHQDLKVPCSLVLVMEYLGYSADNQVVKEIDIADRFGWNALKLAFDEEVDKARRTVLLSEPSGEIAWRVLDILYGSDSLNDFLIRLYEELDKEGHLEKAKSMIKEEEERFLKVLSKAQRFRIEGLEVVYSKESFAPQHSRVFNLGVDLIIERNAFSRAHTSIIKNTSSERTKDLDLSKVFNLYKKVFIHQNGFIAVVDCSVEEVDVEKIVREVQALRSLSIDFPSP